MANRAPSYEAQGSIPYGVNAPAGGASSLQAAVMGSSPPSSTSRPNIKDKSGRKNSKAATDAESRTLESTFLGPTKSRIGGKEKEKDKDKDKSKGGDAPGDTTSPKEKKSGFLGILSSKKSRDKSPRRENGVLGKEGARVIISGG